MKLVNLKISPATESMIDEITDALEKVEGQRPARSHIFRLAVASMRKRMSDEGLLEEKKP